MVLFRPRWIKRLLRKSFPHMREPAAVKWHRRLSYLYLFLAWNTFGVVLYSWKKGKLDYAEYYGLKTEQEASRSKAVATMEMLGIPKARIITLEGFRKVKDEEYVNEILDEQIADLEENFVIDSKTKINESSWVN